MTFFRNPYFAYSQVLLLGSGVSGNSCLPHKFVGISHEFIRQKGIPAHPCCFYPHQNASSYNIMILIEYCVLCIVYMIIWQSIWSKPASWTYSGITLDIKVFSLWRTSYWYIEDKTYKKLKEIPSRDALKNLPEKSMHKCLNTSETHCIGNL